MSFAELRDRANSPFERVRLGRRPGTISLVVEERGPDLLRVVVQGFLRFFLLPGSTVALDGFYKRADGKLTPMPDQEFYEFD